MTPKTQVVLRREPNPVYSTVAFESTPNSADPNYVSTEVSQNIYENLGNPKEITVTIQPEGTSN